MFRQAARQGALAGGGGSVDGDNQGFILLFGR